MKFTIVFVVITAMWILPIQSLVPFSVSRARSVTTMKPFRLWSSVSQNDDADRLKDSAARLRKEVEELELKLAGQRAISNRTIVSRPPPVYTSLQDSYWKMTYRFASEPTAEKDDDDTPQQMYYSGSMVLLFKGDGYTDLISHEPAGNSPSVAIEKLWGWDEEVSSEDGLRYVLWSANIRLPKEDPSIPETITRFYFQAQIDVHTISKSISLSDGTVTVKKDIEPPGGFWGVFNAAGILAQFRYVGNFVQKPTEVNQ